MTDIIDHLEEVAKLLSERGFHAASSSVKQGIIEIKQLRNNENETCPFDNPNDPRADIAINDPCPVCGMLGKLDAENICITRGK